MSLIEFNESNWQDLMIIFIRCQSVILLIYRLVRAGQYIDIISLPYNTRLNTVLHFGYCPIMLHRKCGLSLVLKAALQFTQY